jgi:biotin carboxylase
MDKAASSIMIFGAGVNQLELIREARHFGITTVVIDPQEDPPGKPEADFFYHVDGSDYQSTRSIALKHSVAGIVTGQMEKPLRLMTRLAEELGLIFNSPEVTERCIDKWLMKETFRTADIPCAAGILIRSGEPMPVKLPDRMMFPLIIKPRDAYSSRGVYKCNSFDEVEGHKEESRSYSSTGDVLLEEFIEGKEYSIEAITYEGKTTIIQFTEKFITPYPNTVETGHLQPAELTSAAKEVMSSVVKSALKALGLENSASHTEIIMTKTGPKLIETAARLGGDFIASYLTKSSTGISMDRAAVQVALGTKPDLTRTCDKYSMIKYIELPEGKVVKQVLPCDDIRKLPGVVFTNIFLKKGDKTEHLTHSALRPACILAEADDREELLNRIEEYAKILSKRIVLT